MVFCANKRSHYYLLFTIYLSRLDAIYNISLLFCFFLHMFCCRFVIRNVHGMYCRSLDWRSFPLAASILPFSFIKWKQFVGKTSYTSLDLWALAPVVNVDIVVVAKSISPPQHTNNVMLRFDYVSRSLHQFVTFTINLFSKKYKSNLHLIKIRFEQTAAAAVDVGTAATATFTNSEWMWSCMYSRVPYGNRKAIRVIVSSGASEYTLYLCWNDRK